MSKPWLRPCVSIWDQSMLNSQQLTLVTAVHRNVLLKDGDLYSQLSPPWSSHPALSGSSPFHPSKHCKPRKVYIFYSLHYAKYECFRFISSGLGISLSYLRYFFCQNIFNVFHCVSN